MVTSLPYPDDDTVSQSPVDVTTDSDDYQANVMNTSDTTDSDTTAVPTDSYPILDSISVPPPAANCESNSTNSATK
jgi:hypothetical protein